MKNKRMLMRVPVLSVAILMALLLLAGTYSVIADSSPSAKLAPNSVSAASSTFRTSGWLPIAQGQLLTFTHNLGLLNPGLVPEQLAVELWFKDTTVGGVGVNRRYYGGLEAGGKLYGAHWQRLTANTIEVYRQPNDDAAYEVLVNVWIAPPPDTDSYDSGWRTITQGVPLPFDHNLGITATDLTVGLWFSSTDLGIHHFAYGGLTRDDTVPTRTLGAFWHNLTNNSVQVTRFSGDLVVEQARVVVQQGDPPDYDSLMDLGWQNVAPGGVFTFTHNLNWNPNLLLVRGECRDIAGGLGINHLFAGGNEAGGSWRGAALENLTSTSVKVFRRNNDQRCDQFRVRIWKRSLKIYLPLVMRD